jgi:hypothetical protein
VLHDSVEEIDGYTLEHIEKNYWENIAKAIKNMTKKWKLFYEDTLKEKFENYESFDDNKKNKLLTYEEQEDYYSNMSNWWLPELKDKFADRIDSLQSMDWLDKDYLIKKIDETKKYFLIQELNDLVWEYRYNKLSTEYEKIIDELENNKNHTVKK